MADAEPAPLRIQLRRVLDSRKPPNTRAVTRPGPFGNPFRPGRDNPLLPGRMVEDNRHAWRLYQAHAPLMPELVARAQRELRGMNLACFCRLCPFHAAGKPMGVQCDACEPCHVDPLLLIANSPMLCTNPQQDISNAD